MQKEVWTDEKGYWFLNILATHPDSQGKGIGGALVRHITRMVSNLRGIILTGLG
jgi:GNAT superfamily N-acetyltransferase